jgi:hypothetical protein
MFESYFMFILYILLTTRNELIISLNNINVKENCKAKINSEIEVTNKSNHYIRMKYNICSQQRTNE